MTGVIMKATAGYYFVEAEGSNYMCRATALLRLAENSPLVGDIVEFTPTEEGNGYIKELHERRNFLVRPPVSNIDLLLLVVSLKHPSPNLMVIDRLITTALYRGINCALVFTKSDLTPPDTMLNIYSKTKLDICVVNSLTGEGVDSVKELIKGRFCVLSGNSGVGKSSLLNALDSSLTLKTSDISYKLGRGKHTTRTVERYPFAGGYVVDTPGFSSLETIGKPIPSDELALYFPEFPTESCTFHDCSHTKEKGCAVLSAISAGQIAPERHRSYMAMYEESKKFESTNFEKKR